MKRLLLIVLAFCVVLSGAAITQDEVGRWVDSAYTAAINGRYAEAIRINEEGISLVPPDSVAWLCEFYSCQLYCYHRLGDYDRALDYGQRCLAYDEQQGNAENLSASLGNIAGIYSSAGQQSVAEQYLRRAIQIEQQLIQTHPEHTLKSMAVRKAMLGEVLLSKSKGVDEVDKVVVLGEALQLTQEALEIDQSLDRPLQVGMRLAQLGHIYDGLGQELRGRQYTRKALDIARETGNVMTEVLCLLQLGQYREAAERAQEKGLRKQEYEACDRLYQEAKARARYSEALQWLERARVLHEQLQGEETQRQLTIAQVQYDTYRKEQQLEEQEREIVSQKVKTRTLIGTCAVALIVLVLLTATLVLLRRRKKTIEETAAYKERQYTILSHDLMNPMIAQRQVLRVLYRDFKGYSPEEIHKLVGQLLSGSDSQLELLRNLSEVARLDRTRGSIQPLRLDLSSVARDCVAAMESVAEMKQVTIRVSAERLLVVADRNSVRTILTNLLSNAIKFTPPGGEVEIGTIPPNRVYVRDNGVGMSGDRVRAITSAASPLQSTIGTTGETGTGIGLLLCRELIRLNNGSLTIDSREGEGTTCTIMLPVHLSTQ